MTKRYPNDGEVAKMIKDMTNTQKKKANSSAKKSKQTKK